MFLGLINNNTFEIKEEIPEDYQQYFNDVKEYGYSMKFNTYNEIDT